MVAIYECAQFRRMPKASTLHSLTQGAYFKIPRPKIQRPPATRRPNRYPYMNQVKTGDYAGCSQAGGGYACGNASAKVHFAMAHNIKDTTSPG